MSTWLLIGLAAALVPYPLVALFYLLRELVDLAVTARRRRRDLRRLDAALLNLKVNYQP